MLLTMDLPHLWTASSLRPSTPAISGSQTLFGGESNKGAKADGCDSFAFSLQLLKNAKSAASHGLHDLQDSDWTILIPSWNHDERLRY